jgi:cell division inhibitor SepF
MAGAMRKMAVYLGLVEDGDRYDDYDERYDAADGYDDSVEPARRGEPAGSSRHGEPLDRRPEPALVGARPDRSATVATLADRRGGSSPLAAAPARADLTRITTLHPRTYNEARTLGEHFRDGTPVIMNLSEMDDTDAKRLVDFAAGLIFGLRGRIERVTAKVFLLSPDNVTVTAEDKARIAEGGFFNQS